jgi:hypothetical protein
LPFIWATNARLLPATAAARVMASSLPENISRPSSSFQARTRSFGRRPSRTSGTRVAAGGTRTSASRRRCSSASVAVMIFVVEAIGSRRCGRCCQSTAPVAASTTIAPRAEIGGRSSWVDRASPVRSGAGFVVGAATFPTTWGGAAGGVGAGAAEA